MIGKEILNYRIIKVLGQGGMGTVYLGVNKFIQEQKVAIKVINHEMLNEFTRQRMEAEAHRLASLNHPNVVHLMNFHRDENGTVYLIMEYAEGISVKNYLGDVNGLIVEERICPIFDQILDGIAAAHRHQSRNAKGEFVSDPIIHCDIKPENVIITLDKDPTIKILDFGIAQILSDQNQHGRIAMGTPSYMSPEQVKGEKIDIRSDIYSLGVVLHQMLTGKMPYDTTTLTDQQICQKVVEEPLPRMATYYKYISDKLQKVVDKATTKNPADRYQTCEDFKKALHKAVYKRKIPLLGKIAAIAVVALLIGAGIYAWNYNRVKTYYYKDYVEQWGIPQGIGELSSSEHCHASRSYKFTYQRGKLRRVSHVNSMDFLIEDEESERSERPIDQEFYYHEDKVWKVKVKDRCGKVLYVKMYNESLKDMAFTYDDEHNTEMLLSNSSVSYNGMTQINEGYKGNICRFRMEYDDYGYVKSESFYGTGKEKTVCDMHGICGRTYIRDMKGRPTEIHYLGEDSMAKATKWGLAIKTFEYDSLDNWVRVTYLKMDSMPALSDKDGYAIMEKEYNQDGNVTRQLFKDGDGQLMRPKKHQCYGVEFEYNDKGLAVKKTLLGADTCALFMGVVGYAIVRKEYDEHGYCKKEVYYGTKNDIIINANGYAMVEYVNDEHGNHLQEWYFDTKGNLCEKKERDNKGKLQDTGVAGIIREYDYVGRVTKEVYRGVDKDAILHKTEQVAGYIYEYNDKSQKSKEIHLGKDLKPAENKDGVICYCYEYIDHGNEIKVTSCDIEGNLMRINEKWYAGWKKSYNSQGNCYLVTYLDTDCKTINSNRFPSYERYTYDTDGNMKSKYTTNYSGKLICGEDSTAWTIYSYNKGNCTEERYLGVDSLLTICKDKEHEICCAIRRFYYDENGNCDSIYRYQPCQPRGSVYELLDSCGWAIKKMKYDTMNNLIEEAYFDNHRAPTFYDDKQVYMRYHKKQYQYDTYGRFEKNYYYDNNNNRLSEKR